MKGTNTTTHKKTGVYIGIGAAAVVLAVCLVIWLVQRNRVSDTAQQPEGTYAIVISSGEDTDSTVLAFDFSAEDMTYKESITVGGTAYDLAAGTYTYDEEAAYVVCTPDSGSDPQNFILSGSYLIADGFFYEGEIPDGKSFDAVCTYTNSAGTQTVITFSSDGTYTEEGGTSTATAGTYERKGDLITRSATNGSPLVDFLIYQGQISNSYYVKQ